MGGDYELTNLSAADSSDEDELSAGSATKCAGRAARATTTQIVTSTSSNSSNSSTVSNAEDGGMTGACLRLPRYSSLLSAHLAAVRRSHFVTSRGSC